MATLTFFRPALLALVAGLLTAAAAQAQTTTAAQPASNSIAQSLPAERPMLVMAKDITIDMRTPPSPEDNAAFYDNSHKKDLGQALAWMQESNAISPTYWNLYTEARILLQMGNYAAARTTAEKAYQSALKAMPASEEYVMLSAKVVAASHLLAKQ